MLSNLFEILESNLIKSFETRIKHNLTDGMYREWLVKTFLEFVPDKFSVDTGFVFDSHNNKSKQLDLIIYDSLYVPKFFKKTYTIIPIESVVAIVQVKTTVRKAEYISAVENLNSIDKLIPEKGGTIIRADGQELKEKRTIAPLKILITGHLKKPIEKIEKTDIDIIYSINRGEKDLLLIKNLEASDIVSSEIEYEELISRRKSITNFLTFKENKMRNFSLYLLRTLLKINNTIIINYDKYWEGLNEFNT